MSGVEIRSFLKHQLWLVLLAALVAGAPAYFLTAWLPKIYEASATVLVAAADPTVSTPDMTGAAASDRSAATYAELLKSRPVVEAALANAGIDLSYDEASNQIDVSLRRDAQLIQVRVRSGNADQAAQLANQVVQAAIEQSQSARSAQLAARHARLTNLLDQSATAVAERSRRADDVRAQPPSAARDADLARAQAELVQAQQNYTAVTRSIQTVDLATVQAIDALSIIEPAVGGGTPILPRVWVNVALGALVGMVLGMCAALAAELLSDRLLPPERVPQRTGLTLLGLVDHSHQPLTGNALVGGGLADAFRGLRATLRSAGTADESSASLLVTSGRAGEGKTTVAVGLAIALAHAGERVVLVDGNLHAPRLHTLFGLPPREGLTSLLAGELLDAGDLLRPTAVEGLRVLGVGKSLPQASDLLASHRMRQSIAGLCALADVVLVDAPPLTVSDALALSGSVDGVVLVTDARRTGGRDVRASLAPVRAASARVIGVVLNHARSARHASVPVVPARHSAPAELTAVSALSRPTERESAGHPRSDAGPTC